MIIAEGSRAKKMGRIEFLALSASTMTLTALGIDIMLPAFAAVRVHFGLGAESTATAQIISFFFMGQVAQIVFGIFSDRYGRLPVLRIGFPLYIFGGLAAAFSPTLGLMLAARFIAGVGASALFMVTVAGVRDRFVGDEMARTMSLILTIFLFTPVIAPFVGVAILSWASWKTVFLTPPLFAMMVFLWSFRLEESLPVHRRLSLTWAGIRVSAAKVFGNRKFLRYTAITTLLFTALSCYVSSSERIVGEIYGKPELFAWIFGGIGMLMAFATLVNFRLTTLFGARLTIRGLLVIYTCVATTLMALMVQQGDPPDFMLFFVFIAVLLALNLAVEPNSSALALEPLGEMAGFASSVYGTVFFFVGAALGTVISGMMIDGVYPLVASVLGIGVLTTIIAFTDSK